MENLPIVIRIFILGLWMFAVPAVAGGCFCRLAETEFGKGPAKAVFLWISGQMLLWAGFQVICVPMVIRGQKFSVTADVFSVYTALLFICGAVILLRRGMGGRKLRVLPSEGETDRIYKLCCGIFAALLLLQLLLAVAMTCADGDDAYYVAVSTITNNADTMYQKLPYTGGTTEIDVRHALAPFPIWISYLSLVSGIRTVSVAHVAVQIMLIPMTYGIFGLLGKRLFRDRRKMLPLFLIFTEILVIFGGYSIYSAEHFMLARSRQGKTVLCCIVIPLLFLLLLILYENLQNGQNCEKTYWLVMLGAAITGCLCSTMGAILICVLLGIAGACGAVCYRRWKCLPPLACCCIPCLVFAFLYMIY